MSSLSLFIPRVDATFSKEFVEEAFSDYAIVERVDFVAKQDKNGKNYNATYVHLKEWKNGEEADIIKRKIVNKQCEFYYDRYYSNNYWIVLPNTAKKYVPGDRKKCIDIGNVPAINVKNPEMDVVDEAKFNEDIEMLMEEEENYLITIDGRYVQELEDEVVYLRRETARLWDALMKVHEKHGSFEASRIQQDKLFGKKK